MAGRRVRTEQDLMERVRKMLPKDIPASAIAGVEIDNSWGWNGYWVYLHDGYRSPDMGCHTIHEDTLKELAYMVGNVEVWEDDPDLIRHKGYTRYEEVKV